MAERRMFSKTIIDSDAFLDMPLAAQALYFHFSMQADDDGFINNPKKTQRMLGASDDDLRILITNEFIIEFPSGVVVIKHWKINNYIRGDRKRETVYPDEMALLETKRNGAYALAQDTETESLNSLKAVDEREKTHNDGQVTAQYSIGKYSIDKYSTDKNSIDKDSIEKSSKEKKQDNKNNTKEYNPPLSVKNSPIEKLPVEVQAAVRSFIAMREKQKKPMTDDAVKRLISKLGQLSRDPGEQVKILNQSEDACWMDIYPLKESRHRPYAAGDNMFLAIAREEGIL